MLLTTKDSKSKSTTAKLLGASVIVGQMAILGLSQSASAAVISYDLLNGSDGALGDQEYGIRLDDLFATPPSTNWSFSFEDGATGVKMEIDTVAATVEIFGMVVGGEDLGDDYRLGGGTQAGLSFLFDSGVNILNDKTGFFSIDSGASNFGSLVLLDPLAVDTGISAAGEVSGGVIALADLAGGASFTGTDVMIDLSSSDTVLSAGSVLPIASSEYSKSNERLFDFKVDPAPILINPPITTVPEPSILALLGLGLAGIGLVRRRKIC